MAPGDIRCKNSKCGETASLHERFFVHGNSSIRISSTRLDTSKSEGTDDVWSWLEFGFEEEATSLCIRIGREAMKLSFSHLLTLLVDTNCFTYFFYDGIDPSSLELKIFIKHKSLLFCLKRISVQPYSVDLPTRNIGTLSSVNMPWITKEIDVAIEV